MYVSPQLHTVCTCVSVGMHSCMHTCRSKSWISVILSLFINMFTYPEAMPPSEESEAGAQGGEGALGSSACLPGRSTSTTIAGESSTVCPKEQASAGGRMEPPQGCLQFLRGTPEKGRGHASPSHPWPSELADGLLPLLDTSGQR